MEKVVHLSGVGDANSQKLLEGGNDLSEIQQGLFIGSVAEATNKDLLKSSNVTHILTVVVALAPPYPDDFVYKVIEVVDRSETDLTVYFDECFSFIDQAIQSGGPGATIGGICATRCSGSLAVRSAVAMNAEIRRTKARLSEEVPKLQRLAVKRVKGLTTEELAAKNDLVLALPARIELVPYYIL